MATMWKRIKRSHKKASKFKFTLVLQELQLVATPEWHPQLLAVSFMHRRRKVSSKQRQWEQSYSRPEQSVIVWPSQTPENIDILTTLYKGVNDEHYDDKEWTIVVEDINSKGKRKPIAAVPLNMRLFVNESPEQKSQLKLKMRPLVPKLQQATIVLILSSQFLSEGRLDEASQASSAQKEALSVELESRDNARVDGSEVPVDVPVRPPWRDKSVRSSATPDPIADARRKSTELVFEVNDKSLPILVPSPPIRHASGRASTRTPSRAPSQPPPEKIEGEPLLNWAQRVTKNYQGVRIQDLTKSWRSGIALCALIHAYRNDLIGDFDSLDFSDTLNGRKANVKKALLCATSMGLTGLPDENDILTPDTQTIRSILEKLRGVFEGSADPSRLGSFSDHRISNLFQFSEAEKKMMEELKQMKNNIDNYDYSPNATSSPPSASIAHQKPTTSYERESMVTYSRNGHHENGHDVPDFSTKLSDSLASPSVKTRAASPARREVLRQKARDMLKDPSTLLNQTHPTDNAEVRERAKQILEGAFQSGATYTIKNDGSLVSNLHRTESQQSNGSRSGSNTDLRRVGAVPLNVPIRSFRKQDPSPVLQRKEYATPLLPAMGRTTQQLVEKTKLSETTSGSTNDVTMSTPTRQKITSKWEADVADPHATAQAQAEISERMRDLDAQAEQIRRKMNEPELGDDEEPMLIETLQICQIEKDRLVNKQEYYNIIGNIRATILEIQDLKAELGERGDAEHYRTAEEKERTDDLMEQLKRALGNKNDLIIRAIDIEEQIEERANMLRGEATRNSSSLIRKNMQNSSSVAQRGTPQYSSMRQLASSWFS